MKTIEMSPTGLGAVRFALSPLAQVGGLLRLAAARSWHPRYTGLAELARRALSDPRLAILAELTPPGGVGVMPLIAMSPPGPCSWQEELDALRSMPIDRADNQLALIAPLGPRLRASLQTGTVTGDVADALHLFWHQVMADQWPALMLDLRAEIARCAGVQAAHGLSVTLNALAPTITWTETESGGKLTINKAVAQRSVVDNGGIVLLPNLFQRGEPLVSIGSGPHRVSYPCIPAEPRLPDTRRTAMARLIGETRARVLDYLQAPITTTELAARLDLPASTVSTHLKVLHEAGLITRRRDGRRVLYERPSAA